MFLNNSEISGIKLGNTSVSKIFLGENLVFGSTSIPEIQGTLWAWGGNYNGELGDGTYNDLANPTQIGNSNWTHIQAGDSTSVAIKSDGSLWSWGENYYGFILANGSEEPENSNIPIQLSNAQWKNISVGSRYAAIKNDDTLWLWGHGPDMQNPSSISQLVGSTWKSVSCGKSAVQILGIKPDNTLWAWGSNPNGAMGLGSTDSTVSPTQVGSSTWTDIATGYKQSIGIQTDGTLWQWGLINTVSNIPQLKDSGSWSQISAGYNHCAAIKSDGTLWMLGDNNNKQINSTTNNKYASLVQIGTSTWKYVACGSVFTVGIRTDGTLWAWGYVNANNQINMTQIGNDNTWVKAACGYYHTLLIKSE